MLQKLVLRDRVQAVVFAYELGLVTPWRPSPVGWSANPAVRGMQHPRQPPTVEITTDGSMMLQVDSVTKTYGGRVALSDVSFGVGHGRITGFVGANGAGKTTTMRIILGVLSADSGAVRLGGATLTSDDRRIFGYMPEERGLYPKMRVAEQITYFGRLHGIVGIRHNF